MTPKHLVETDIMTAAIEAEYRRQRADLLIVVQRWLRDVWLQTISSGRELLNFPELAANMDYVDSVLRDGAQRARAVADGVLGRARKACGLR